MRDVLVTMRFGDGQLEGLCGVSSRVRVTRVDPAAAHDARSDTLYAGTPPRDLGRAPNLYESG